MKISELRMYVLENVKKDYLMIAIETDSGVIGFGEGTLDHRWRSVAAGIEEGFGAIVGEDPTTVQKHWSKLTEKVFWGDGASGRASLSAIDTALWDLTGKIYGLPVHKLLGGAVRETVPVYLNQWWAGYTSTADLIAKAQRAVESGARALKWYPFGMPDGFVYQVRRHDVGRAVEEVRRVREAVGPSIDLMVDVWRRLDWSSAAAFCAGVLPYNLVFVEEPTEFQSAQSYARLSECTHQRIAMGERLHSRKQFAPVIETQAVGLIQPSIIRVGGLTEAIKIGQAAETYSIGVAPHNPHGPVAIAASVVMAAVLPNFVVLESYANDNPPTRAQFVNYGPLITGDEYIVSDAPGLGVELNEERLAELSTDFRRMRGTDGLRQT